MKKISAILLLTFIINFLPAFEWPVAEISIDSISSNFGDNNNGLINTSLIFKEKTQVTASENGTIIFQMQDESEDSDFFPSTLGNTIILSHEDELISVYGNLEEKSVKENISNKLYIKKNEVIGYAGNSGWQQKEKGLEFQIIDLKKDSAINPKVLLPRLEAELPLYVSNVVIINKNNVEFELNNHKSYPNGFYRIYQRKTSQSTPYKTILFLNGIIMDQIDYDTVNEENKKIYVSGKKKYVTSDIYPKENLQLLGEVSFTPGKSTLGINLQDILGNTKHYNYNITIY